MLDGLAGNTISGTEHVSLRLRSFIYISVSDHKDVVVGFLQVSNALNCCGYLT
jgi:hypothetical protein